jgi:hypothetical protein
MSIIITTTTTMVVVVIVIHRNVYLAKVNTAIPIESLLFIAAPSWSYFN